MYGIVIPWPIVMVVRFIDVTLATVRRAQDVYAAHARRVRSRLRDVRPARAAASP